MPDLQEALASAKLYTDGRAYTVIHLPPAAVVAACGVLAETREPFGAVLVDKDEVTLVLEAEMLPEYAARLPGHAAAEPFRLITFDMPLDMNLVGFMAAVSRTLAEAGVSLMAFSAYQRDHLLVPAAQFGAAWAALEAMRSKAAGG